jgi:hypothetical protein
VANAVSHCKVVGPSFIFILYLLWVISVRYLVVLRSYFRSDIQFQADNHTLSNLPHAGDPYCYINWHLSSTLPGWVIENLNSLWICFLNVPIDTVKCIWNINTLLSQNISWPPKYRMKNKLKFHAKLGPQHNKTERKFKNLKNCVPYYCVVLRNTIPVVFFTKILLKEIFITNGQCLKGGSK